MLWLFTQMWMWIIVALLLGVAAGWLFWARPLRERLDALESSPLESSPLRSSPHPSSQSADPAR